MVEKTIRSEMRKIKQRKKSFVKTSKGLIFILLFSVAFLFSGFLPSQNVSSQFNLISSVSASKDFSSYSPRPFRSDSNQTHLLFLHEKWDYDQGDSIFYHMYELVDGSWSTPVNLENLTYSSDTSIVMIQDESDENNFSIYFTKNGELLKKAYNGQNHQWTDSEIVFNKHLILDYLHLQSNEVLQGFRIHSYYRSMGSEYFVWSFSSSNLNHKGAEHYHISQVYSNGTIKSCIVEGDTHYYKYRPLNFVYANNMLMVYSPLHFKRTILSSNGSWSPWQISGWTEGFADLYGQAYGEPTQYLIFNRYLLNSHTDENFKLSWGITDLTATNMSVHPIQFPYRIKLYEESFQMTFKFLENTEVNPKFVTAFQTNISIELWTYDLLNNTWTQINQFENTPSKTITYWGEDSIFNVKLLTDGDTWRIFWNQRVSEGNNLHEIFTVSYNTETDEWSLVTQITYTRTITDDYTNGIITVLPFFMTIIVLSIVVVGSRVWRKNGP